MADVWSIDIDDVNSGLEKIDNVNDELQNFITEFENLVESIGENNEAKFLEKVESDMSEALEELKKIIECGEDISGLISDYLANLDSVNSWSGNGIYNLDKEYVLDLRNDILKIIDLDEKILSVGNKTTNKLENLQNDINEFNNVDSSMDEATKYEKDVDAQNYISRRRIEIEQDIIEFKNNEDVMDDFERVIQHLERELDDKKGL